MKANQEKISATPMRKNAKSDYVESLIARSRIDKESILKTELIFREVSRLASPMREEVLVRLILDDLTD